MNIAERFALPLEIDEARSVFPANIDELIPPYREIPEEFRDLNGRNEYIKFQMDWFYRGFDKARLSAKPGVDLKKALRHLSAVQGSFAPKHEHKVAAVAWLASLWLEIAPESLVNEGAKQ